MKDNQSYFGLVERNNYVLYAVGCCQSQGKTLMGARTKQNYCVIDTTQTLDIFNNSINDVKDYVSIISKMFDITYSLVDIDRTKVRDDIGIERIDAFSDKVLFYEINCKEILSNKHFVACHTLIRYMWQTGDGIIIAKIILHLYRKFMSIYEEINDHHLRIILGIALSFNYTQVSRGLVAYTLKEDDIVFVPEKSQYLKQLAKDNNLYTVFGNKNIIFHNKIKITGDLFEDSSVELNAKYVFLSNANVSTDELKEFISRYEQGMEVYSKLCKYEIKYSYFSHTNNLIFDDVDKILEKSFSMYTPGGTKIREIKVKDLLKSEI